MKKMVTAGIVLFCVALMSATPALAFEGSADAYVGVYSKYLWRGFDVNPDDDFVVQGGTDVSFDKVTVSFWANANEDVDVDEVDIVLDYSFDASELVSVSVGNILYEIAGFNTNELYLSLGFNTILEPSLSIYYDYDAIAGDMFYTASIGHSYDISDTTSAAVGALVSYADFDKGFGYSDLHNGELSASLDYVVNDNISIGASALYTTPLSDDAEDIAGLDDEVSVGLAVTVAF